MTATLALSTALGGCGTGKPAPGGANGKDRVPEVGYVVAQMGSAPLVTELTGRTAAYQTSEVRPQVSGLIERRLFAEGSLVRAGQTLYQIDARLFRAGSDQARAALASAEAAASAAQARADRFKPLAEVEAVSQQEYVDAQAQARQATAAVAQARAA
ncbi:MAG: efflux transporter periplasmic adaptor subunit, partial [Zymomonas sp.]|nr:efflux transporter periplasmic adaptor subunit [Zymomonas sp.]